MLCVRVFDLFSERLLLLFSGESRHLPRLLLSGLYSYVLYCLALFYSLSSVLQYGFLIGGELLKMERGTDVQLVPRWA